MHFGEVIAFEPDTTNLEAARRNINGGSVRLFHAALGDGPGSVKLCGESNNCGAYQTATGEGVQRHDDRQACGCRSVI